MRSLLFILNCFDNVASSRAGRSSKLIEVGRRKLLAVGRAILSVFSHALFDVSEPSVGREDLPDELSTCEPPFYTPLVLVQDQVLGTLVAVRHKLHPGRDERRNRDAGIRGYLPKLLTQGRIKQNVEWPLPPGRAGLAYTSL